ASKHRPGAYEEDRPAFRSRCSGEGQQSNPVFSALRSIQTVAQVNSRFTGANLCCRLRFCRRGGRKNPLILPNVMSFVELGVVRNGSTCPQNVLLCINCVVSSHSIMSRFRSPNSSLKAGRTALPHLQSTWSSQSAGTWNAP